jgi:chemotaxis protein methyltransferase CheR
MKLVTLKRTLKPLKLTNYEFNILRKFLLENYGIDLKDEKKSMLESRLIKRINELGLSNFKEYINFLFSKMGSKWELPKFLDIVTTHKTEFFRNREHFDILEKNILPEFYKKGIKFISVWSAGCSSGEEVYTIAMIIQDFITENNINMDFHVLGTDISEEMLTLAQKAIYHIDKIKDIDMLYKKKFFLKSKNPAKKLVRIVPELRAKVNFRLLNLIDTYNFREPFNIIFCRNVAIYFNTETQKILFENLLKWLDKGGYLFLGHSESLFGYNLPVVKVFPTIYKKI